MNRLVVRLLETAAGSGEWSSLRPGVDVLRLWGRADEGPSVALLRYQPETRVPAHRHAGFEVIYVLSGSQSDERGTYAAGTLVVNPEGAEHSVWSDEGCLVLIIWQRPVEFVTRPDTNRAHKGALPTE